MRKWFYLYYISRNQKWNSPGHPKPITHGLHGAFWPAGLLFVMAGPTAPMHGLPMVTLWHPLGCRLVIRHTYHMWSILPPNNSLKAFIRTHLHYRLERAWVYLYSAVKHYSWVAKDTSHYVQFHTTMALIHNIYEVRQHIMLASKDH